MKAWAALALGFLVAAEEEEGTCKTGDCSQPGEYFWPQQKGNINRTGFSPYAVARNLSGGPTWVWKDPNVDVIRSTPLIDDGMNLYLGTQAGRMYKFSPDGALVWYYRSSRGNTPTVSSIMDGSVYLNTAWGFVVALDMKTGKERWATKISESTSGDTACVFAINGTIISATRAPGHSGNNNLVVALRADGTMHWRFKHVWPSFNFQASSPGDGTIVFQDASGGLYRLGLEDGRLVWESGIRDREPWMFTTAAAVVGPNGVIYCVSNYRTAGWGIVHTYRLSDGAPLWRREVGMLANQAVAYGQITGAQQPAVVLGIGENPGQPAVFRVPVWLPLWLKSWIHNLSIEWKGHPTWFWRTKLLPAALVALDAKTGAPLWSYVPPPFFRPACEGDEAALQDRMVNEIKFPEYNIDNICLPDNWAQAVIGGDGTVYAGHQDGKLYAVRDANGNGVIEDTEVSFYYFGHAFQGSQAIAPGMLAVVPCGGGLYVWKS